MFPVSYLPSWIADLRSSGDQACDLQPTSLNKIRLVPSVNDLRNQSLAMSGLWHLQPEDDIDCAGVSSAAQNSAFPSQSAANYNYGQALHLTGFFFDSMISGTNLTTQRLAW